LLACIVGRWYAQCIAAYDIHCNTYNLKLGEKERSAKTDSNLVITTTNNLSGSVITVQSSSFKMNYIV